MKQITGNESITATPSLKQGGAQSRENDFDYMEQGATGLTIRQYFAAMAMQGLLANNTYHNPNEKHNMITVPALAETAVVYADALIAELNTTNPLST